MDLADTTFLDLLGTGAAVGAVVIGLIDAFTKVLAPEFAYFTIFAPMALVLVFRPRGLFGRAA